MSRSGRKKDGNGGGMTRGEFLATGAMAGVGGVLGMSEEAEAKTPLPQTPGRCSVPCDIALAPEVWAVPAGALNALWSEVLPKIAAWAWEQGTDLSEYLHAPGPKTSTERLVEVMEEYETIPGTSQSKGGWEALNSLASNRFLMVRNYLTNPTGRIPIRVSGEGGYDFLLSDAGLDVFIPRRPSSSFELIRYYTFRRTGRRPIGTPLYLTDAPTAVDTDSPTGPGQIVTSGMRIVEGILDHVVARVADDPDVLRDHSCELRFDATARRLGIRNPENAGPGRWYAVWRITQERRPRPLVPEAFDFDDFATDMGWTLENRRAFEMLMSDLTKEGGVRIPQGGLACVLSEHRCWQLEGSVYRGMMTEFPRLVAEVWLEEEMGINSSSPVWTESYRYRISPSQAADINSVEREIFKERLETMLPGPSRMHFQTIGVNGNLPASTSPWAQYWNAQDVMITNKGLFYPPVGNGPSFGAILEEIKVGRAGNPVFTDSMRTEGRGG